MGIATRLKLARVLVVVPAVPDLAGLAAAVARGGADAVVAKDATLRRDGALRALGTVRASVRAGRTLIGYSGAAAVAGEFGADLLLLSDDAADAASARRSLSPWAKVGRSCNREAEIDAALADAAVDFLLVGPGLDPLRHAAHLAPPDDPASKPWFAAGGITERTVEIVLGAGALRVAVGRGIVQAPDAEAATRFFADRLRRAWLDTDMEAVRDSAFEQHEPLTMPTSLPTPGSTNLTL